MLVATIAGVVAISFIIAAVLIGREVKRLNAQPGRAVFNLEEAVVFVADRLPFEVSAEISYDDVRALLRYHLDYLGSRGVIANGDGPHLPGPVVIGGSDAIEEIVARAAGDGVTVTPAQVYAVLQAQLFYLETIGAIGAIGATGSEGDEAGDRGPEI